MHRKECAELRDSPQGGRVEARRDGAELAARIDLPRGLGLRPRTEAATEVGVHGRDGDCQRVGDRHEEIAGDVLEAPFDLGQVGGGAAGLSGDLTEAAPLPFAMAAQDRAELLTDLVRCYAQSRIHNAQSISPHWPGSAHPGRETRGCSYRWTGMATLLSVNVGDRTPTRHNESGVTGIDKRPSAEPVLIRDPGPGTGRSGLPGDLIGDPRAHGGTDQAVYAFAREELDFWQAELGRPLPGGVFGENLTTLGLDLNTARIGDRWQVGRDCVLEVTSPRIPCSTFATWLDEQRWVRRFTERGVPGAYLRVIVPGGVAAGDEITLAHRPAHDVSIAMMFRALTTEKSLVPQLAAAGNALPEDFRHPRDA